MSLLNQLVVKTLPFVPKSIVGQVSKRYIAGITLPEAVRVVKSLNVKGFLCTLDLLGEDVHEERKTYETQSNLKEILRTIQTEELNSNLSIKPTQLGMRIDKDLCYRNIRVIVEEAKKLNNFVRIDMEDSTTTGSTLDVYERLRSDGFDNVGVVIQAYLHRSEKDIRKLAKRRANIRLCKGIYLESPDIAFQDREEIRRNFVLLLRIMFEQGFYVGIATHDDYLVDKAYELISKYGLKNHQYEFQMLLGVREPLRDQILEGGHKLRVYVPFGEQWYAYSTRRLKENPQIAGYVFKSIFSMK
jgi:proline dehydrogenase